MKIVVALINELITSDIRTDLQTIKILGNLFVDNDSTIARKVFNLCFFIYGIDSLLHGLYLNRIIFKTVPWFLTHRFAYILHFVLGVFMFILFYALVDVNDASYVMEGIYSGLILLSLVPIMYMYNNVLTTLEYFAYTVPVIILFYVGYRIRINHK